jgi:hypothetical protein
MNWLRRVWNALRGVPPRPARRLVTGCAEPAPFDPDLLVALQADHQRIERQALKLLDALRTADPAVCAWLADAIRCALTDHLGRAAALYGRLYGCVDAGARAYAAIEPLERDLVGLVARFEHFCVRGDACGWRGPRRIALAVRFEKIVNLLRVQFRQEEADLHPLYRATGEALEPFPDVEWRHDGRGENVPPRVYPPRAAARRT